MKNLNLIRISSNRTLHYTILCSTNFEKNTAPKVNDVTPKAIKTCCITTTDLDKPTRLPDR